MVVSKRDYIESEVMKNLLSAHKIIAENGNSKHLIKLSNYILRLLEKRKDKLLELGAEKNNQSPDKPPNKTA